MKKQLITELLTDFHERQLPDLIDRELNFILPKTKKAVTIIGPRRAGKTFFLFNIMKRLKNVDKTEMVYVNLEDDRLLPLDIKVLDNILRSYYEIYPQNRSKKVYLFLDEIQNVDNWEKFVRRVLDTENIIIFLTGSSSKLLAKEIATSMRGRAVHHIILPFSFREFLSVKNFKTGKYLSSDARSWLLKHLDEYLTWGGFPEVILEDEDLSRIRTLKDYIEIMLIRDIAERYNIKNITVLRLLLNTLQGSFAKEFSVHKFFYYLKSQGIKVSKNTLYEYFHHFEDAFAVITLKRFSYSIRKTEQSLPKVYQIDNGYAAQLGSVHSPNVGRLMENAVAIEWFRRAAMDPKLELFYWKNVNGNEVDFVIKKGPKVIELVQVCYDVEDYLVKSRELKALIKASSELGCDKLIVITWDQKDTETHEGKKIEFIPLWSWLVQK